jgi:hypothetical protein
VKYLCPKEKYPSGAPGKSDPGRAVSWPSFFQR